MLRFRWPVLGVWAVILVAGLLANLRLSDLLSNEFRVPGTESELVRDTLADRFGQRDDGTFLVVFRGRGGADLALEERRLRTSLVRAARVLPGGQAGPLRAAGRGILFGNVSSPLRLTAAKERTDEVRAALGRPAGAEVFVTGPAAIQADLDPIFKEDLRRGEGIALPIAFLVLLAVFGVSLAVLVPFLVAGCTIMATLGLVFLIAHEVQTAVYVTNLVQLVGLGLAIDYSLLIVYRFREELQAGGSKADAVVRTMTTAGRAVAFSGAVVAIGLALLLFIPLPFVRSIGVGGFLIPLVSVAAALTLQPALLYVFGRRGIRRVQVVAALRKRVGLPLPRWPGTSDIEQGFWARLARSIMRRPAVYLAAGATLLVLAAAPALGLQLTPGSTEGTPRHPESIRGFSLLSGAVGPGALSPTQVLVDTGRPGGVRGPAVRAATARLVTALRADPEVALVGAGPGASSVDRSERYAVLTAAGRHEYGAAEAQSFARRLRSELIPAARFPAGTAALAGGGPAQGIDFLDRAYSAFPWLVAGALLLTYILLVRAFRSLLLPLKAVLLNLLSVGATYGILVLVFRYGIGTNLLGLYGIDQIEGWIPIFLFAMLFGLSMDYEVFLVARMREFWDEGRDNESAVASGLERTGRIVTAAAIIMVAAFSGFMAGRIVGLQQFGLGLASAILIDATLVRAVLVPALMKLFGRYNWWLPANVARLVRVQASPLRHGGPAARPVGR